MGYIVGIYSIDSSSCFYHWRLCTKKRLCKIGCFRAARKRINAYRDKCFAVQDYSAAIQNMLLAIVDLGYQSCWYEGHITDDDKICDKMAQILNVPDSYELVCHLPIGIAESDSMQPKKKAFEERAWFNSFPQE
ncbi:MAG: nitroreductase family protein [Lachnospiraceae bacterium]|nr:nitroreductase family protein [Lachnospiraceae bacterium]